MSAAKSLATTFLRTLVEGVSWPKASVRSLSRIRNLRIDSARDAAVFASSTASWISVTSSGSAARSRAVAPAGRRCCRFQNSSALGVQRHQAGDVGAAVADYHALADQRMPAEPVLQHLERDVRASRGDD